MRSLARQQMDILAQTIHAKFGFPQCRRGHKVAGRPRFVAFCFARLIGSSRKSIPVTFWPRLAKNRAFSPGPHPASRMLPVILSATSMIAFGGLPMSHGG